MRSWNLKSVSIRSLACKGDSTWELLYAGDLVLIADSVEDLMDKYTVWKEDEEIKGRGVNVGETKVLICGLGEDPVVESGRWSCVDSAGTKWSQ